MKVTKRIKSIDSHAEEKQYKTITSFLNEDYRDYSNYVISTRAIPSLIDGFKVGARKIMHAAFRGAMKNGAEIKNMNLIGDVYNHSLYLHGDASLHGTVFTLSAEFADNLNPISISGQHGSLRDPKAVSAPRYLYCKLSKWAKLYKIDEDLLDYVFDEGMYLEPFNYLPIIPTVLTSRSEGMAPGYKFSSFSYNPLDIVNACIEYLNTNEINETVIRPYVRGILNSKFVFDKEVGKWCNLGSYKADLKNDIFQVTDLPYDMTYDKFEKILNGMIDSGYIKDWKNYSVDGNINYWLIFQKTVLTREMQPGKKEKLIKKLGLESYISDDILYVLDENKKVRHFENKVDLIKHFVDIRLAKYNDRKSKLVDVMEKKFAENDNICKFIELVNSGTIVISNRKQKDVKEDLKKYNLPDSVLTVQISKLTNEEKEELLKKNKEIKKELKYIKNTTIKDMYLNDLNDLKKEFEVEFI